MVNDKKFIEFIVTYQHDCIPLVSRFFSSEAFKLCKLPPLSSLEDALSIVNLDSSRDLPAEWVTYMNYIRDLMIPTSFDQSSFPQTDIPSCLNPTQGSDSYLLPAKKIDEVKSCSQIILDNVPTNSTVIDFGAGKGYLSLDLAARGYHVLAIEGNPSHSQRFSQRLEKIRAKCDVNYKKTVAANQIGRRSDQDVADFKAKKEELDLALSHLEVKTHWVTPETDMSALLPNDWPSSLCYIGLHACGDLSVIAIKNFLHEQSSTHSVTFPCCFHKLSEDQFPITDTFKDILSNIPHSYALRTVAIANSGMKKVNLEQIEATVTHSFTRALVGAVLFSAGYADSYCNAAIKKKDFTNSLDFFIKSCETFLVDKNPDFSILSAIFEAEITNLEEVWKAGLMLKDIFTSYSVAQTLSAFVFEAMVLQDRLLYCSERGASAELVQFISPDTSPRCFALVLKK